MLNCIPVINSLSQREIDDHLAMGKNLLDVGKLADALTHYHLAIGIFLLFNKVSFLKLISSKFSFKIH